MEYESTISQQDAGSPATNLTVSKDPKLKGELAELAFMYKAASLGFGVAKPYGDSQRFDFILSIGKQLWKVQVKSTGRAYGPSYQIQARGTRRRPKYTPDEIDFLVAFIVPLNVWYVVPAVALETKTMSFWPFGRDPEGRYEQYREAWHLMMPAADPEPVTADPASAAPALAALSLAKDALE
ncbi:MAG TPA: group I intron-associated PD-(D/E)XK endonuclease [Terriglobales bacterium]|jgi:hypothetical protein|nr:group I intron-associated PD-(D/E)XK endonuclease [Terriglobales bacterium]